MEENKLEKEIENYFACKISKIQVPDLPKKYKTAVNEFRSSTLGKCCFAAAVFLVFFVFISPSFNLSEARTNSIGIEDLQLIGNGLNSYFDNLFTVINKELN